jgi:peptide/nickel transport system ATP-binding protein
VSDTILDVAGLTVGYRVRTGLFARRAPDRIVLDDVSFRVERGESLAIVGPSGAGKTTLSRALLRLVEPARGTVVYRASRAAPPVDLLQLDARALRAVRPDLQIVFQDPLASLNPRMTVIDVLREALGVRATGAAPTALESRAVELLEQVGLSSGHAERFPHELSGGERQRVCLARALAPRPKLVVLDEAVASLDVSIRAQVLNLLVELKRDLGLTYVFVAHDPAIVHWFADRTLVLKDKRLVAVSTIDDEPSA